MQASTKHTQAHTQKESQAVNRIQMPLSSYFRSMVIHWLLHVYTQTLRRSCFVFLVSSKSPPVTSCWMYRSSYTCSTCRRIHLQCCYLISATKTPCSTWSCVSGWPSHLPVNQLLEMSSSLQYKTHTVFHVQMSVFFFFPWCFMSFLSDCCRSKDGNLCAKISRFTFWSCWHAWHCPNTDLFDTVSICMYALLTCALLTFATLTELKRSESLACYQSCQLSLSLVFWWQLLMSKVDSVVFVSLAAWQVHRQQPLWWESQQSHRGDEVEGRLREGCQGIVAQQFSRHTCSSQRSPLLLPWLLLLSRLLW